MTYPDPELAARLGDHLAGRLMMLRRGNPDMGGPNMQDKRWGYELALDALTMPMEGYEGPTLGDQVAEATRLRAENETLRQRIPATVPPLPRPPGNRRGHEPGCESLYGDYHCTCQ